jgi:hypothetical protein
MAQLRIPPEDVLPPAFVDRVKGVARRLRDLVPDGVG